MKLLRKVSQSFFVSLFSFLAVVAVGYAATTIGTNIVTTGTLEVTGNAVFSTASSTGLFSLDSVTTLSASTLASTTITSFKVGQTGTQHSAFVSGYCTAPSVSVTATSSGTLLCASATGVVAGDRIFVTATSSLPAHFVINAASSTTDGVVQIRVFNIATTTADSGTDDTGLRAFNFWAVR